MALQLTQLRIPNMTTDYSAETNAAAQLGKTIAGIPAEWRKQQEADTKRQLLGSLGQDINSGNFQGAAAKAFSLGDIGSGAAILGLGQKAKEQQREADWLKSNSGLLGGVAPTSGASPTAALGSPNDIENTFVGTVKQAGLTNPIGLGAVAAYGKAESGFDPKNVNRVWNDPSESGQPGQAGGIMSWRGPRLEALNAFARERGEQAPSPETQALFLAKEDPNLIPRLNAAQTPQEANRIMADAWRFAGYNRPGGENARREALTTQYAQRFAGQGGQPQQAAAPAPQGGGGQTQTAQAPVGSGGVYAGVDEATLNGYINSPQVPANLKSLMQQELARRQGGGAPVQVAQAPAQPGDPRADELPVGGSPAQFTIPGTTPQQTQSIMQDRVVQNLLRAYDSAPEKFKSSVKQRLDLRIEELKNARGEEGRQADIELKRLQAEAERRKLDGDVPAPAGYRYKKGTKELEAIPGGPAFEKTPAAEVESRKAAAARAGVTPTDPRYQSYVLTGKTPREDAQPLSATDKKAILEADEGVLAGETAIRALNEAKALSKQAMSGPTAGARAMLGNNLPDMLVPDFIASPGAAEATTNLENTVTAQALAQMKSIFGAAPTEGERKILLDIQGSIGQPDNVRQKIYDRAIKAAEARLAFNKQRAAELRGGDYYKAPGARQGEQPQRQPQQQPPAMQGARVAPDGNTYIPDPNRPGKYLMVQP